MAGRPKFVPTSAQRSLVAAYSASGMPHKELAAMVGVSPRTLTKAFSRELKHGLSVATGMVAGKLFSMAMSGNVAAVIFWLKTKGGYREQGPVPDVNGEPTVAPTPDQLWDYLSKNPPQTQEPSSTAIVPSSARPVPSLELGNDHGEREVIDVQTVEQGTVVSVDPEPAPPPPAAGIEAFGRGIGIALPAPPVQPSNVVLFSESDAQRARRLERERQQAWNDARDAELKAGLLERERRMRAEAGEADESGEGAA